MDLAVVAPCAGCGLRWERLHARDEVVRAEVIDGDWDESRSFRLSRGRAAWMAATACISAYGFGAVAILASSIDGATFLLRGFMYGVGGGLGLLVGGFGAIELARGGIEALAPDRVDRVDRGLRVRVRTSQGGVFGGWARSDVTLDDGSLRTVLLRQWQLDTRKMLVLHASGLALDLGWCGLREEAEVKARPLARWLASTKATEVVSSDGGAARFASPD